MKVARRFLLLLLLVIPLLLLIGLWRLFQSETYGLTRQHFDDGVLQTRGSAVESSTSQQQGANAQNTQLPNIIVILADDLGYGDVGAYGGQVIKTPHIDQLTADGLRFTSAYSSAPICSPSRAGLLTGRYPARSGIVQAMQAAGDSLERKLSYKLGLGLANLASIDMLGGGNLVNGLPQSEITIAELLRGGGYATAVIGKWHLGDFTEWPQYHPFEHGFDHFVGFNMSNDDWPVAFYRGEQKVLDDIGLDQAHYTKLFTEEAIAFVESSTNKPFFLYLSHKDPHQPFFPSEAFANTSDGGPYGDAVSEFDWSVGEVMKALNRLDLAANTLVIVTSDNGPWYEGSSGGLRGRKGQSYEGGFRVPMIAWWPGTVHPGSTNVPVMNIDFFSTFAKLARQKLPTDRVIDGRDLSPLLRAESNEQTLVNRSLYFFHDFDVEGIRQGPWKVLQGNSHYVWPAPLDKPDSIVGSLGSTRDYSPPGSDESVPTLGTWPLLYHLGRDAEESYNVADRYPEELGRLSSDLHQWKKSFYANPGGQK